MMRREGGRVVIEISEDEFDLLLIAMGYATAAATTSGLAWRNNMLRLVNAINEGNLNYTPYEVPENVPVP